MPSRGWLKAKVGTVLGVVVSMLAASATMGCGPYEPEPATPYGYWVRAEPPTSAELAANPPGRVSASDEVAIGEAASGGVSDTDPSALTEFREVLAPHGAWVEDSTYGTVWVPSEDVVGSDFEPYVTAGRWTYDDASDANDWVWVSDYSWGWAPFHYGRWVKLPGRGWSWIPGRAYSGAWVTWRTGPVGYGYVGWAPMAPSWYWSSGVAVGWGFGWYSPYYVYCPSSYLYHHHDHVVRNGPVYQDAQARTQPRTVASPGVGAGDRTVASPGVGGRNVASPGTGGRGPSPSELGHAPDVIARPPSNDPGLSRARAMASSRSTAREGIASRSLREGAGNTVVGQPSQRLGQAGASPSVSSRLDATARAPGYQGVQPSSPRSSFGSPNGSAYAAPPPAVRQSPGYASPSSPSFRSSPSSSPSFGSGRSGPSSSPSFGSSPSSGSAFRSSPSSGSSFRSSPSSGGSFRSSPSSGGSFRSSPSSGGSFRSSPSSGGSFRSSPSSGGSFRGGGGGGGGSMRGGGGFRGGRGR